MLHPLHYNFSDTYSEIPDFTQNMSDRSWRDGLISGNGLIGYVTSGAPYSDTFIFQHMYYNYPDHQPRHIPDELLSQLNETRKKIIALDKNWDVEDKYGNPRAAQYYYAHHPGPQLRLTAPASPQLQQYRRYTNYNTAETIVEFEDPSGCWEHRAFTSRADNVVIIKLSALSDSPLDISLSFDPIEKMCKSIGRYSPVSQQSYKQKIFERSVAFIASYPSFPESELAHGGYGCLTRVIAENGTIRITPQSMHVTNAKTIYLITAIDRTFHMNSSFLPSLDWQIEQVLQKYTNKGRFSYDLALNASVKLHAAEWNKVSFQLEGDEEFADYSAENLLKWQREHPTYINRELIRRIYQQSRFAMLCCSGYSAPRLHGLWTGEWNPGWRGIYTLDANVNLQVSPMNTANLPIMAQGYITFFLRHCPDFMENARMAYGMHDAIQPSVNADADRAMHIEYKNAYPFQYWNAGASWCLLPIFEYWQCFGNQRIPINDYMRFENLQPILSVCDGGLTDLQYQMIKDRGYLELTTDILLPLLTKAANFWEQLVTPQYYCDPDGFPHYDPAKKKLAPGEKYLILPSYSPENTSPGFQNAMHMNATMDIAAARDCLHMLCELEEAICRPGYKEAVERWTHLLNDLPDYLIDTDGALKEWSSFAYEENNNHRHVSHLYPAWPAYEAHHDPHLSAAIRQALANRDLYNTTDDTAGHGWIHRGLVEVRIKDSTALTRTLQKLLSSDILYSSLMTDHDTNRRKDTYCTDTAFGLVCIINESLIYSDSHHLEVLPAIPAGWTRGQVFGLMARTCTEITDLTWDLSSKRVRITLRSLKDNNQFELRWKNYAVNILMHKNEIHTWEITL